MPRTDWGKVDIEFNFDSLLRADKATRLESQAKAVNAGLLTPNEGRAEEGLPSKPGGDTIYLNGTLVPAGTQQTQVQADTNGA
jgi:phage portal protein BeeE